MQKNLQNARIKKGLTQRELAALLKVTSRHYQEVEGGFSRGSVAFWIRAKEVLNETLDYLLGLE